MTDIIICPTVNRSITLPHGDQPLESQTRIEIYSDGSCIGNPGPGGYVVERQPPWPVASTILAGGAERKTGMPVWRAVPPAS
jgi:hypothetical protein